MITFDPIESATSAKHSLSLQSHTTNEPLIHFAKKGVCTRGYILHGRCFIISVLGILVQYNEFSDFDNRFDSRKNIYEGRLARES
ncbi:hypothetical protein RIR_jg18268.t1 [Rhizophagus irregularis DAOM 181602=DAOM 197198]|nr:hypothetical protein RIR_jg18268.t1 [Rhizophagus irregularis DAOM 181602=DAOM 197198]